MGSTVEDLPVHVPRQRPPAEDLTDHWQCQYHPNGYGHHWHGRTGTRDSDGTNNNKNNNNNLNRATLASKDYSRWRPSYHLIASHGWMNDPCAPGYIPSTGVYHVGYQWNPNGAEWGDIVWGKAFSRDLVSWDVSEEPSLQTDKPYDHAGVFTGCWRPTDLDGSHGGSEEEPGKVSLIYTSVSRLPIHYTKEYFCGSETLSVATSGDGGNTWVKKESNPILSGPPKGLHVTGWRDPYVAPWPAMSKILGRGEEEEEEHLFGIISGGIRDKTPTNFLYKVDPKDLTRWDYVAPLVTPGLNFSPSRWTGDLGVNWEVTSFLSLAGTACGKDSPALQGSQDFIIFGTEGCKPPHGGAGCVPGTRRCNRAQLWMAIDPKQDSESTCASKDSDSDSAGLDALMKYSYGGTFDHGLYYAASSFWDPVTEQHIVIGWVTEEDIPVELQLNQNWSGLLSLPRAVSMATIDHVVRACRTDVKDMTNVNALPHLEHEGLFTVQTLSIAPEPRLQKLRARASRHDIKIQVPGPTGRGPRAAHTLCSASSPLQTAQWEAYAEFSGVVSCGRAGLVVHHASSAQTTKLYLSPAEETFVIERPDIYTPPSCSGRRPASTRLQDERAPFTLFTTRDPRTGVEAEERLKIHVFCDGSVLEVFINERAVITTRVYLEDMKCTQLDFFSDLGGTTSNTSNSAAAVLEEAVVWDGLSVAT